MWSRVFLTFNLFCRFFAAVEYLLVEGVAVEDMMLEGVAKIISKEKKISVKKISPWSTAITIYFSQCFSYLVIKFVLKICVECAVLSLY